MYCIVCGTEISDFEEKENHGLCYFCEGMLEMEGIMINLEEQVNDIDELIFLDDLIEI